jgi:hypothetical protein
MEDLKFKNPDKVVPDAYHGTSQKRAEKIIKDREFLPSTGEDQYLGDGFYFFESSEWHAKDWARRRFRGEEIGVICAIIYLGNCLDLNNRDHVSFVKTVAVKLAKMSGRPVTDAIVINYITTFPSANPIDTVRASHYGILYQGGRRIFPGSHFLDFSQLMICVKNVNNIKDASISYRGL